MANDHFVAKVVTRPWELPGRRLRVFDFVTREFSDEPVKRLFAKEGLNSPELEQWLGEMIDDPIGKVVLDVRRGKPPQTNLDWPRSRAVALLVLFQGQRIAEARGEDIPVPRLEEVMRSGVAEQLAQAFYSRREAAWIPASRNTELVLTESVLFPHPALIGPPALLIPLALHGALVVQERKHMTRTLDEVGAANLVTGFSMGVGTNVHRIILPPSWSDPSLSEPEQTREELLTLRELTRRYVDTVARATDALGLRGWRAT